MTFYNAIVLKKEDVIKNSQLQKAGGYIHIVRTFPKVYSSRLWKKTGLKIVIEGGKK